MPSEQRKLTDRVEAYSQTLAKNDLIIKVIIRTRDIKCSVYERANLVVALHCDEF